MDAHGAARPARAALQSRRCSSYDGAAGCTALAARRQDPPLSTLELDFDLVIEAELPPGADAASLEELVRSVLVAEGASGAWTVTVVLTDDARLRALHRNYLGVDSETDVMTFPFSEPAEDRVAARGGDIVLSVERAAALGPEYGHSTGDEVRFLVVHGVLHLCGWRDDAEEERSRMLARQSELLRMVARGARSGDAGQG